MTAPSNNLHNAGIIIKSIAILILITFLFSYDFFENGKESFLNVFHISLIILGVLLALVIISLFKLKSDVAFHKKWAFEEAFNNTVFSNLSDAVIATNKELVIEDWNKGCEALYGWKKEEVIGKNVFDVVKASFMEAGFDEVIASYTTKGHWKEEALHYDKENNQLYVHVSSTIITDKRGRYKTISVVTDFTRQKKLEEELHLVNKHLEKRIVEKTEGLEKEKALAQSIINSLPGNFYLFDAAGKFILWNENFSKASGYSHEEIATMSPQDCCADDEKEFVGQEIGKVFTEGVGNAKANLVTKSGEKIPYYYTGVLVEVDNQPCVIGMGLDITDLKEAEDRATQAIERFELISIATNDVIWDWDILNDRIWWNDNYYTHFEYAKEELPMSLENWMKGIAGDKEALIQGLHQCFEKRETYWTGEYKYYKGDGAVIDISDRGYINYGSDGRPIRMVV